MKFSSSLLFCLISLFFITPEINGMKRGDEGGVEEKREAKKPKVIRSSLPLCQAIQDLDMAAPDMASIDKLLAEKVNIHEFDTLDMCALWYAVEKGALPVVKKLWPLIKNDLLPCQQAIILACACGYADIVKFICQETRDLVDSNIKAAFLKKIPRLQVYVDDTFNAAKITPLIAATSLNNIQLVELLLSYNPNLRDEGYNKNTALCIAAQRGYLEIVEKLIRAGAFEIPATTISRPLQLAILAGNLPVTQLLLKAKPAAKTADQSQDLIIASLEKSLESPEKGYGKLAEFLIERELNSVTPQRLDAILDWVVCHYDNELLHKIRGYYKEAKRYTNALFKAALKAANQYILQSILTTYPEKIDQPIDERMQTPLSYACAKGSSNLVIFLCKAGANKDQMSPDELLEYRLVTPVVTALLRGYTVCAGYLLAKGADVNRGSQDGQRALDLFAQLGRAEQCSFLLDHGAFIGEMRNAQAARARLHLEARQKLSQAAFRNDTTGPSVDNLARCLDQPESDFIIFIGALKGGHEALMLDALNRGHILLNKHFVSDAGLLKTPLGFVCARGQVNLASFLIAQGARVSVGSPDEMSATPVVPFVTALLHGHNDLAQCLLTKGATVDENDGLGFPPLHYAVQVGNVPAQEFLITHNAPFEHLMHLVPMIAQNPTAQRVRAAHIKAYLDECSRGNAVQIENYLRLGMCVDEHYDSKKSPLVRVLESGNLEAIRLLLEKGAISFEGPESPLKFVLGLGDPIFELFVTCFKDTNGFMPLFLSAAKIGLKGRLERLLKAGVPVDCYRASDRVTAIMLAAAGGHRECVEFLLRHNAQVAIMDKSGKTALQYAKTPEIEQLLKDSDSYKIDQMNRILQRMADSNSHSLELCDNVNMQDAQGKSLLRRALEQKIKNAVSCLLQQKADVNLADKDGMTPLMYVASQGDREHVELLCSVGATIVLKDKTGMTAVGHAGKNGFAEIVTFLYPQCPQEQRYPLFKEALTAAMAAEQSVTVKDMLERSKGQPVDGFHNSPPLALALETACGLQNRKLLEEVLAIRLANDLLAAQLKDLVKKVDFHLAAVILKRLQGNIPVREFMNYTNALALFHGRYGLNHDMEPNSAQAVSNALISARNCAEFWKLLHYCIDKDIVRYLADPASCFNEFTEKCRQLKATFASSEGGDARDKEWESRYPELLSFACGAHKQTLLMWACIFGDRALVEKIRALGLPRKYINHQDEYGRTALMYALLYGNLDCALALIQHKQKDAAGNENSVNHCGLRGVNLIDKEGKNALFYAAQAGLYDRASVRITEEGKRNKVSAITNSLECGALYVIKTLRGLGAKLSAQTAPLAIKMVAEAGNTVIALKVLNVCSEGAISKVKLFE